MAGIAVMLNPAWPGSFSRNVRDEDGKSISRLTFLKGEPQVLSDEEFAAVMGDIGRALVYSKTAKDGTPIGKPDWEATKADAPA